MADQIEDYNTHMTALSAVLENFVLNKREIGIPLIYWFTVKYFRKSKYSLLILYFFP